MKAFHNKDGKPVLMRMVSGIKENKITSVKLTA